MLAIRIFIATLMLAMPLPTMAVAPPILLQDHSEGMLIGRYLDLIEDESQQWTIAKVSAPDLADRFVSSVVEVPNWGFSESAFFARFTVRNTLLAPTEVFLENGNAAHDYVTLFTPLVDGSYTAKTMGDRVPFLEREIPHIRPVHRMLVPPGDTTYYYRVQLRGGVELALRLWTPERFYWHAMAENILVGGLHACLLILILYNVFVWIGFGGRTYGYYVAYLTLFLCFQLQQHGLGMRVLFQGEFGTLFNNEISLATIEGIHVAASLFGIRFLGTRQRFPRLTNFLYLMIAVSTLNISLNVWRDLHLGYKIAAGSSALLSLVYLTAGVRASLQRYRPAYFYTLAWAFLLSGNLILILRLNGRLPTNTFTAWGQFAGGVMEALLLSLALADRMSLIRSEAANARSNLAAAQVVQQALLPDDVINTGLKVKNYYRSADETGGDWFGYFQNQKSGLLYVMIGDVTGHGIASAILTGAVAGTIRTAVEMVGDLGHDLTMEESLRLIAKAANSVVWTTGARVERLMTMAFVALDTKTGTGAYINAGHCPVYIVGSRTTKTLLSGGSVLGFSQDGNFRLQSFQLSADDSLFFYTDGLIENTGPEGGHLSVRELRKLLASHEALGGIQEALLSKAKAIWRDQSPQDDYSFLFVQWQPEQAVA